MKDPSKLADFVAAQNGVYEQVLRELEAGQKQSHWMWFIFPQLQGLGSSVLAQKYGLESLEEARSYLKHKVLGPRLSECTQKVLAHAGRDLRSILGYPDDLKFRSSMTLFAAAAPEESIFEQALKTFCGGQHDPLTMRLLANP